MCQPNQIQLTENESDSRRRIEIVEEDDSDDDLDMLVLWTNEQGVQMVRFIGGGIPSTLADFAGRLTREQMNKLTYYGHCYI